MSSEELFNNRDSKDSTRDFGSIPSKAYLKKPSISTSTS